MKLLVLDNYDSFTYNLVHMFRSMNVDHEVYRNDKISPEEALSFDLIILSPGPGSPSEAGNMGKIIAACAGKNLGSQIPNVILFCGVFLYGDVLEYSAIR